jgi:hypothetical protein
LPFDCANELCAGPDAGSTSPRLSEVVRLARLLVAVPRSSTAVAARLADGLIGRFTWAATLGRFLFVAVRCVA